MMKAMKFSLFMLKKLVLTLIKNKKRKSKQSNLNSPRNRPNQWAYQGFNFGSSFSCFIIEELIESNLLSNSLFLGLY